MENLNARREPFQATMTAGAEGKERTRRFLVTLPLLAVIGLVALFYYRLGTGDPQRLPSALIGKPAPVLILQPLEGLSRENAAVPGLGLAEFAGRVTLVNVWASWCGPCRDEHPQLTRFASDPRIRVVGINYKDASANALNFLARYGNPFVAVGIDQNGRAAIEWGVYGVPETFMIGRDGRIVYKHVGPITEQSLPRLQAEIDKALAAGS